MEFKGIIPQRQTWVKVIIIILAVLLLVIEFLKGQYIYIPIAAMVVLACFFQKEHIVSEEGVDIKYILFGHIMHNYWRWDEITTMHADYRKARPNIMLHIGKDIVTRSFVMDEKSCKGALELATRMNPKIYIQDIV